MEPVILIGGGVGPMAGVALHALIIENTVSGGSDQGHLDVYHISRSRTIPDRTEYLAGRIAEDPSKGMFEAFRLISAALAAEGRRAVGGIPCNTFHAPRIFSRFAAMCEDTGLPVRVLHMLQETLRALRAESPGIRRVGILSTTGTRESGVYDRLFEEAGLEFLYVRPEHQAGLHELIYHREWGLKAVSPPDARAVERLKNRAEELIGAGAEAVILGCTELPLGLPGRQYRGVPLVDPMRALARALIREAAPEKLAP